MLKVFASDDEILNHIDNWVLLLEQEDYYSAFNFTKQNKARGWSPELIREIIKSYGDGEPSQKVTLLNNGLSIDGAGKISEAIQTKKVVWLDEKGGYIWYDLNVDNYVSDLTATFDFERSEESINIQLDDIHIM